MTSAASRSLIDYKGTPALLVASKQGDLYVLDRATGKPLTPGRHDRRRRRAASSRAERAPRQIVSLWHTLQEARRSSNPTCGACRRSTR